MSVDTFNFPAGVSYPVDLSQVTGTLPLVNGGNVGLVPASVVYVQPTSGSTISPDNTCALLILDPAGLIATLTVKFPASPSDGWIFRIATGTNGITILSMQGNGNTVIGALTTLLSGGASRWYYRAASTTWYRIG